MSSQNGIRMTPAERSMERSPLKEDRPEKSPGMPSLRARIQALRAGVAPNALESGVDVQPYGNAQTENLSQQARPYRNAQTENLSQQARLQTERVQSDLILRGLLSGLRSLHEHSQAETADRQSQQETNEWRRALKVEVQRRMNRFQSLHGQPQSDSSLQVPPASSLQSLSQSERNQQVQPESSSLQSQVGSDELQSLQSLHSEYQQSESPAEQSRTLQALCDELGRVLHTTPTHSDMSMRTLVTLQAAPAQQLSAADRWGQEWNTTLASLQAELNATNPQSDRKKEARGMLQSADGHQVPPAPPSETLQELPAEPLTEEKLTNLACEVRHMFRQLQLEAGTSGSLADDWMSSAGSTVGRPQAPIGSQGKEHEQTPPWHLILDLQQEMAASNLGWQGFDDEATRSFRPRVSALLRKGNKAAEDREWQNKVDVVRSRLLDGRAQDLQREEIPASHASNFMNSLLDIALHRNSSSLQETRARTDKDRSSGESKWNRSSSHTQTSFSEALLAASRLQATESSSV